MTSVQQHCRNIDTDTQRVFDGLYNRICVRTDRMFGYLLIAQWCAGILVACWLSPYTWSGAQRSLHVHVEAALLLGGAITIVPVFLVGIRPGHTSTRYVVGAAQVLWSGLLIHLTGGRIETHFHIFGSLACLAFYRDYRVLIPATVIVALDHFVRGLVWPESIYGVLNPEWWRFLEHGGWIAFINAFLLVNCINARRDLLNLSLRQAELQCAAQTLEAAVDARTQELLGVNGELQLALTAAAWTQALHSSVLNTADEAILTLSETHEVINANPTARAMFEGDTPLQHISEIVFIGADDEPVKLTNTAGRVELRALSAKGDIRWLSMRYIQIEVGERRLRALFLRDITDVKNAEAQAAHLNRELMRQSRLAGLAEMATGVLHNVGNVLNSVNVAATTMRESICASSGEHITRLLNTAERKHGGLEQMIATTGATVTQFLAAIAKRLDDHRDAALGEVDDLQKHVDHIKAVIAKQQGYARGGSGLTQRDSPASVVADALLLMHASLTRHTVTVDVQHEDSAFTCALDRHRVLQILINLISNARDALKDVRERQALVTVATKPRNGRILFIVSDNGIGIDTYQGERMFTHGFTTKPSGHGFGLHNCAIAAKDMGGSLTFRSDGLNCGATFTLELPLGEVRAAA